MVEGSVKVEGFDDLFKAMDGLAEEIGKGKTDAIYRKAMAYAFDPVLQMAKDLAPMDTGQLKEHMYLKVQRPQARDKASKYYEGEVWMARVTLSPKREDSVAHTVLNRKGKFQTYYTNKPVVYRKNLAMPTPAHIHSCVLHWNQTKMK